MLDHNVYMDVIHTEKDSYRYTTIIVCSVVGTVVFPSTPTDVLSYG